MQNIDDGRRTCAGAVCRPSIRISVIPGSHSAMLAQDPGSNAREEHRMLC